MTILKFINVLLVAGSLLAPTNDLTLANQYISKSYMPSTKVEYISSPTESEVGEDIILDFDNVSLASNATASEIDAVLEGTGLYGCGESVVEAENNGGINALILVAIAALESGWGTSRRAIEDYNYTGLMVFDPSSEGLSFDESEKFASLKYTSELISNEYITVGGKYYVGGTDLKSISKKYSPPTSSQWHRDVMSIASKLQREIEGLN